jgi:hypothetical protein
MTAAAVGVGGASRTVGLNHGACGTNRYAHQFHPARGSVFVVDNAKGQIISAIRHKDNKIQVVCMPATKLPLTVSLRSV